MTEWWSQEAGVWIASLGGASLGIVCGTLGAVIGVCAPRGVARGPALGTQATLAVLGSLAVAAGLIALTTSQPYHVYYPLLLGRGIVAGVMGGLLPVSRRRYAEAEARRLEAEELRRA